MDRERKLKELINAIDYKVAINNSDCSSLTRWFVEILEKSAKELCNFDLIRCIRQNIFIDEIVNEIITRMLESKTPFYSNNDSVEIMEKLASVNSSVLKKYNNQLSNIFSNLEKSNLIELADFWMYEEEKDEFRSYISKIKLKLSTN